VTRLLTPASLDSPSLSAYGKGAEPAYELKFLLDEARAREVEAWGQRHLTLDPHGDPALGGAYRTTSLYCDTPERDVYHGSPWYRRHKFRVRRYGSAPANYLECKSKWGDRVAKRRTNVAAEELALLAPATALETWSGEWFHHHLRERRLSPACRIVYERLAYVGSCSEGPLRLTLDRRVHGILADEWSLAPFDDGRPLLTGQVILEFKFRTALPHPFKQLIAAMKLSPHTVSKYRLCCATWHVRSSRLGAGQAAVPAFAEVIAHA